LQEGRQQGEMKLLLRQLERRFGTSDKPVRKRINAADAQTLLIWGERILTAQSIDEVLKD
jgi:uncharacterized protein DUF4351